MLLAATHVCVASLLIPPSHETSDAIAAHAGVVIGVEALLFLLLLRGPFTHTQQKLSFPEEEKYLHRQPTSLLPLPSRVVVRSPPRQFDPSRAERESQASPSRKCSAGKRGPLIQLYNRHLGLTTHNSCSVLYCARTTSERGECVFCMNVCSGARS